MGPGAAGRVAGSCGPWWPWRGQRGGCPGLRADRRVWSTDWMLSSHRTCSAAAEATDLTTKSAPKSSAHSCSRHRASPPRCFTYFSASRFKMEEVALQRLWRREVTASTTLQRHQLGLGAAACGGRQPSMSSSSAWGGGVWRQLGSGAALRSEALGREVSLSCRCPSTSRAGHPGRTASRQGEEGARAQLSGVRRGGIVGAGARATVGSRAMEESSGAGDGYTEEALRNRRTFCRSD
jgi:hypothetical protein